MKIGTECLPA